MDNTVEMETNDEERRLSENASNQQDAGSNEVKSKPNYG